MRFWVLGFGVVLAGAAVAASPYDGTYRGSSTASGSGNYRCQPPREISIRVTDGKFNYNGGGGTSDSRVSVDVGPDGKFSAQAGDRYLSGRIQGSSVTATSSAARCNYNWELTKQ